MSPLNSVLDAICADMRADGVWDSSARARLAAELEYCDADDRNDQVANEKRHVQSLKPGAKAVK